MPQDGDMNQSDNAPASAGRSVHKNEQALGTVLLILILFFILASIVGIGFVVYSQWKYAVDEKNKPTIQALNEEPAPAMETEQQQPVAEEQNASQEQAEEKVDITKEEISVLNGGGASGSAGKLQEALKKEGLENTKVGSTEADFTGIAVYYAADKEKQAQALLEIVKKEYEKAEAKAQDATKKESATSPLTVIIGSGS